MHRTFVTTTRRTQTYLDGFWDLALDPNHVGLEAGWYAAFPKDTARMWVPGVWNTQRGCLNYEGVGWLHRTIQVSRCSAAVLNFAAATHQANVWLDGEPLGEHYGGYLPFSFCLCPIEPGEHDLVVSVDNTHDMSTTLPAANLDWFRYGGLPRPVWLEQVYGLGLIRSLRVLPVCQEGRMFLRVRSELMNLDIDPLDDSWEFYLGERLLKSEPVHLEPADIQVLQFAVEVEDVHVWSPEDPWLYFVRLAFAGDDLIERTGFREIRVRGSQVLLNGQPLDIAGVNRHEDHPDWGCGLPEHLMACDVDLLQDLGVNALRGAHYPNDQRMLDLCDEQGLLFMEEIPVSGLSERQLSLDIIVDRASAMLWATIERDVNHPCLWAWTVMNECATDTQQGRAVIASLVETAHDADPTRLVTFATANNMADLCYDLVDMVSINSFYGWYSHDLTWSQLLDRVRARIGDKPLLLSEFGAGALYGYRSAELGVPWTEECQRELILRCLHELERRTDLVGFFIWQFCDSRADGGAHALVRPRGYNNKGLLDEYRRPKLAYEAVRAYLHQRRGIAAQSVPGGRQRRGAQTDHGQPDEPLG